MIGLGVRLAGVVVALLWRSRLIRWTLVAGGAALLLWELQPLLPAWVSPLFNIVLLVAVVALVRRRRLRRTSAVLPPESQVDAGRF